MVRALRQNPSPRPPPRSGEGAGGRGERTYHATEGSAMTRVDSPRRHLLLPWTVQEREDPVLEFDHGEGVFFYDRHGRRYLDFLSQLFQVNLGHGNRRVIEAIQRQAERDCCVSPQLLTSEKAALAQ